MSGYKLAVKRPVLKTHHLSQLKLPVCEKKHSEQARAIKKIKSGKLPQLLNQGEQSSVVESQLFEHYNSELGEELPYDIEERVNNILQKNQAISHEYYNEENQNFEANVQRNKEMLKLQREKRGSVLSKHMDELAQAEPERNKKPSRDQGQGRERKKVKKAVSKLKLSAEGPHLKSRLEAISLREDSRLYQQSVERGGRSSPGHKGAANRLEKKVNEIKNKISKRTKGKEDRLHTQGQDSYNENLFDNIHNYLSNPHRNDQEHRISSKSRLIERKQALEEKLRNIECRLSSQKQAGRANKTMEDVPLANRSQEIDYGVTWRRIKFQDPAGVSAPKKISVDASTFEREVSHLGNLQQRNEHSLQRYVQNQRLLHSLKMVRDKSSRQYLKRQFLSK